MSFCVAVLTDENFEEPWLILGASLNQVARSVCTYVREGQVHDDDHQLVEVEPDSALRDWGLYLTDVLIERLENCTGLTLHLYSLGDVGDKAGATLPIETPTSFADWATENKEALRANFLPIGLRKKEALAHAE